MSKLCTITHATPSTMCDPDPNPANFKLVTNKRKSSRKAAAKQTPAARSADCLTIDKESVIRRINTAKEELLESDIYASARASLREGLEILSHPKVTKIVCFGLGRIGECTIARYQLALLLCLRDLLCNVEVQVYDPIFCQIERDILCELNCAVLSDNCEGKYVADGADTTVFYLPHCPKQLSNNLLWANWGLGLSKCIVIANSFTNIIENTPARFLWKFGQYISKILPYVTELAVINSFKFYEVFNDTAIHIFPEKDLIFIPDYLWSDNNEPQYSDDDVEFITNRS